MSTRQITEQFLKSEFASKNLYSRLQIGLPLPVLYKDRLGLYFLFHKLHCTADEITISSPKFEVCLIYPSSRIVRYAELGDSAYKPSIISIPAKNVKKLKNVYESCFFACDEVLTFYDVHRKITPIVLKKYYECIEKYASDIGVERWYGGLYDNNSSI